MSLRPRVAVAGFQHESNSFSPFGAEFSDFLAADGWPALTSGPDLLERFSPLNIPLGGFVRSADIECVPIVWASAEPSGPVSDDAFERMSDLICNGIAEGGRLDGIYLDLHGAMVTVSHQDGEGELLARVRSRVGPDLPIVVSLDMHANVTPAMVDLCDAIAVYRTYPHLDMAATGERCRRLMHARLVAGRPFRKAWGKLPFLIPMSAQCTDLEPFRTIYGGLPGLESDSVLNVDVASGFPPADIRECGPSVIAYGFDQEDIQGAFTQVFGALLEAENQFDNRLVSPAQAVAQAMRRERPARPIILADVQDNPGCGATSDTTTLLRTLVEANAQKAAVAMLWDGEAAAAAHAAGVGAEIVLELGGRYSYDGVPFHSRFRVEALSNGDIVGEGAIIAGGTMSLGPMAQLKVLDTTADVRVVVSTVRFQCLDQALFRSLGVEPQDQSILVVKSTVHFRADFAPIAEDIIMVEAPGANPCRGGAVAYRNLRPGVRLNVGEPDRAFTQRPVPA
ncbi:MAG: M81 family metallopeptidase [Caulobacteraceae bacterium]